MPADMMPDYFVDDERCDVQHLRLMPRHFPRDADTRYAMLFLRYYYVTLLLIIDDMARRAMPRCAQRGRE